MASPQPSLQPPLDYHDDRVGMMVSGSILALIATSYVALRFWSRRLTGLSLGLDDYLVLAALVFHHACFASNIVYAEQGGVGGDIRLITMEDPGSIVILYKSLLAIEVFYGLSSPTVKLSTLAFYCRIFPTRTVKLGSAILASLCIGWAISIEIVNFIQCRPLQALWDRELQLLPSTRCLDKILFFLGNATSNCVIDFATLTFPIHEVVKLHTSWSKKVGICAIFLIGGIAFAASLTLTISLAVAYSHSTTNFTQQMTVPGIASVIEIYLAIIGTCTPTLIPVYRRLRYGDASRSTNANSKWKHSRNIITIGQMSNRRNLHTDGQGEGEGSFERIHDDDSFITADYENNSRAHVACHRGSRLLKESSTDTLVLQQIARN
ncbi:hypothetical protein F5B20DRAFT_562351 [Whalleya microplaca]|nr:hypothetical protein F5B20DRAFT_562351 [Whalleya microplaca]